MTVRVVTAPAYEPVTAAEFRQWARIEDDDAQAAVATMLLKAMREYAENLTGRAYIPRTLQLVLPHWENILVNGVCGIGFELPEPPLMTVSSITYVDSDGVVQTLDTDLYDVHTWRDPGFIVPAWNALLPSTRGVPDAWRVNYTAGYAAVGSPTDEAAYQAGVPESLKLWMRARAATLYDQRDQLIQSNRVQIPRDFADGLLDSLMVGARMF